MGGLGPARVWSRVVVDGAGRLSRDLTDDLRSAGVGQVTGGVFALDAELRLRHGAGPDLVVLVTASPARPGLAAALRARGIPHLPVVTTELEVVVGPLVLPGVSACLQCVDLTRCAADPAWAAEGARVGCGPVGHPRAAVVEPGLLALARATATMTVCAALADQCPPGVSLELSAPWPRPVQRVWAPHPRCRCGASAAAGQPVGREWSA